MRHLLAVTAALTTTVAITSARVGPGAGSEAKTEIAVLAGGCFWGVEAVYEHVKGVVDVTSGFAGGRAANPSYELVSRGTTGHAESVRIVYDPSVISYAKLLEIFFRVAHDPTELDRQGPDVGKQYRSAIFYRDAEQKRVADSVIARLTATKAYPRPIVTELSQLGQFFQAEDYHQDFLAHHPDMPYIVINDAPKLVRLKAMYPALYRQAAGE